VVGSELLLADLQAPPEERLGLAETPLLAVQHRQVVEACGHFVVVGPELLLADLQAPSEERLGLAETPLVAV
jgi:hypothetical protein